MDTTKFGNCPNCTQRLQATESVGQERWTHTILVKGLRFCIPSAAFWAFMSYGKGGDIGGILAFVLGLAVVILGLPWNVVFMFAWGALAQALDHPAWLGDTKNGWFFLVQILIMSTPGAFINGAIVGRITARKKSPVDIRQCDEQGK